MNRNELDIRERLKSIRNKTLEIEKKSAKYIDDLPKYTGPKVIVYAADQNFYDDMERSIKSVIANTSVNKIYCLIEDDKYPRDLPPIVETINVSDQTWFPGYSVSTQTIPSVMVLMRLAFFKLFPQYDRVLSLDADTMVVEDISELFETPMGDAYHFAAVEENRHYIQYTEGRKITNTLSPYHDKIIEKHPYYNAAVLLENLKLLREDGMGEHLIRQSTNFMQPYQDQTLINIECENTIRPLSNKFNWSNQTSDVGRPSIIHLCHQEINPQIKGLIEWYDKITMEQVVGFKELIDN